MITFEAKNISKSFGPVQVLQDVSLAFMTGTVTALVGDNGAGKSTLLKILAGIHKPVRGSVQLESTSLTNASAEEHRNAGIEMVYQDLALAKQQDVVTNLFCGREQLRFGIFLDRSTMRRRAREVLDKFGIQISKLDEPVGTLSGGQQQAIAIARAVLFHPKVLLLDEPTAALAAKEVGKVLDMIQHQKAEGRIVVLVSHRLNDVLNVADRIVVLKHGQVFSDESSEGVSIAQVVERIVS